MVLVQAPSVRAIARQGEALAVTSKSRRNTLEHLYRSNVNGLDLRVGHRFTAGSRS